MLQRDIPLAVIAAAAAAVVVVTGAGIAARAPLAWVPENGLKFAVGVLLTAFGTFWGVEGAGALWPGSDLALLVIAAVVLAFALAAVALLRRRHHRVVLDDQRAGVSAAGTR